METETTETVTEWACACTECEDPCERDDMECNRLHEDEPVCAFCRKGHGCE